MMFVDELANFYDCIKNFKETDIPLTEGLKSVHLAESILKSLHMKKEIKVVGHRWNYRCLDPCQEFIFKLGILIS